MSAEIVILPGVAIARADPETRGLFAFKPNVLLTKAQAEVLLAVARRRGLTPDSVLASIAAEALASEAMADAVLGEGLGTGDAGKGNPSPESPIPR